MAWQKGGWGPTGGGMLWSAVSETVATMAHLETDWDAAKLEKKLGDYFSKGAKNLSFKNTGLEDLVNEYADTVLSSIFAGLGDREWLLGGQVDFLLLLDAGIKDTFPGFLLRNVAQQDFEQMVLGAYERAFDEQRFWPILTDAVAAAVSGPKIKKKVWNSIDQARKDTVNAGIAAVEDFTSTWINTSVRHLSEASQGSPEATIERPVMTQLFQGLLEAGGLPTTLLGTGGEQPAMPPMHIVEEAVNAAYLEHSGDGETDWTPSAPGPKKLKMTMGMSYGKGGAAGAGCFGAAAAAAPAPGMFAGAGAPADLYGPPGGVAAGWGAAAGGWPAAGGKGFAGFPGKGAYLGGKGW